MELREAIKDLGFESEEEFHKLVASVNISAPVRNYIFKGWQEHDGTKEGLLKIIETLK